MTESMTPPAVSLDAVELWKQYIGVCLDHGCGFQWEFVQRPSVPDSSLECPDCGDTSVIAAEAPLDFEPHTLKRPDSMEGDQ